MARKGNWLGILAIVLVFGITVMGCGTLFGAKPPTTFQRGSGGDTTILLRPGLDFNLAFREVAFILNRHGFDNEVIQPEVGFIRTRWRNIVIGRDANAELYRVRAVLNFNPARTQLIVKVEGEWYEDGRWIQGWDTRQTEDLRNDLNMVIGN
ncbi:MAG: hypothetical protein FWD47_11660 [Treponema sp.]|nr:hypothetical protein [Treponema sp.]